MYKWQITRRAVPSQTVNAALRKNGKGLAMLIAGDIGGTKTDPAIYSIESGPHAPLAEAQFHSADFPNLQAMFWSFSLR
jgi:glucokinase